MSYFGQWRALARVSVDTPGSGATLRYAGRRIHPEIWHHRNEPMTWEFLGLVVLGAAVVAALLAALVWYCVLKIARW
jgi:hypothetical protein